MCKPGNQQIASLSPVSTVMGKGTSKLRNIHNLSEEECTAA